MRTTAKRAKEKYETSGRQGKRRLHCAWSIKTARCGDRDEVGPYFNARLALAQLEAFIQQSRGNDMDRAAVIQACDYKVP